MTSQHPDFVTSIAFHPSDDRYFLSGCLDQRLRLWSIVERKVDKALLFPETITAVAYSVNGEMCAAGSFTGKVSFCSSQLEYQSSMRVKSARGKNSKGSKITASLPRLYYLARSTLTSVLLSLRTFSSYRMPTSPTLNRRGCSSLPTTLESGSLGESRPALHCVQRFSRLNLTLQDV